MPGEGITSWYGDDAGLGSLLLRCSWGTMVEKSHDSVIFGIPTGASVDVGVSLVVLTALEPLAAALSRTFAVAALPCSATDVETSGCVLSGRVAFPWSIPV